MSWFSELFGFEENSFAETKEKFKISRKKGIITSRVNGEQFKCGKFSTPSLKELRNYALKLSPRKGDVIVNHIITNDIIVDHNKKQNNNSTFQVASQFNCLEFPNPYCTPEFGITGYELDSTQGPACSLAGASATLYRNYFTNQSKDNQINNMQDMNDYIKELDGDDDIYDEYITVKNGYSNSTKKQLLCLKKKLQRNKIIKSRDGIISERRRDRVISKLRIGLHRDVGIVLKRKNGCLEKSTRHNTVTQVFCSAIACSYGNNMITKKEWEPISRLVLDGSYEATLWISYIEYCIGKGSGKVFLTLLGGGAFGNESKWIAESISKAIKKLKERGIYLEINIVHFKQIDMELKSMIDRRLE